MITAICWSIDQNSSHSTQEPCLLVVPVQTIYTAYSNDGIHETYGQVLVPSVFLSVSHGWKSMTHPSLSQRASGHSFWLHGLLQGCWSLWCQPAHCKPSEASCSEHGICCTWAFATRTASVIELSWCHGESQCLYILIYTLMLSSFLKAALNAP